MAKLTIIGGKLAATDGHDAEFIEAKSIADIFDALLEHDIKTIMDVDGKVLDPVKHTKDWELIELLNQFYCVWAQTTIQNYVLMSPEIRA